MSVVKLQNQDVPIWSKPIRTTSAARYCSWYVPFTPPPKTRWIYTDPNLITKPYFSALWKASTQISGGLSTSLIGQSLVLKNMSFWKLRHPGEREGWMQGDQRKKKSCSNKTLLKLLLNPTRKSVMQWPYGYGHLIVTYILTYSVQNLKH